MLRLLRQISLRQLRASWGRAVLVIGGIATGVALITAIQIINTSVLDGFRHAIDAIAGPAALEVTLGVGEVGFAEAEVETVRADPEVVAAVPLVRGTISLADAPAETLQLFGADLTAEEDLERYPVTTATARRELLRVMEDPRSILLTRDFADRQDVAVGVRIALSTPTGVGEFTVRGLLEATGAAAALGGRLALMDLPAAQIVLGKEGRVDQIDVILRAGTDVAAVQRRLERALPKVLTVARPEQRGAQYESAFASYQALLTGLSTLCLVAGIFIVYNTTVTGTVHRAMVLAQLGLIGAEAGRLLRLLMVEALLLGALGTVAGLAAGVALARLLVGMVTESMGINFQLRFPVQALTLDPRTQYLIAGLGLVAALGASYLAARRVTRLAPLDVLRADLAFVVRQRPSRQFVVWWVVLVGLSALALMAEGAYRSVALGNLGSTLWNASAIVVAVPLVHALASMLSRLLPRLFRAEGRIVAESLFRSVVRTGVTVAAIALVVTVAILLSTLSLSFRRTMDDYVGKFLRADLVVSAVATEGGWLETPLAESVATELSAIPGVRAVEPGRVLLGQTYRGRRIGVLALSDGSFDPKRYPPGWYQEGDPEQAAEALRKGTGATISTTLSDRMDLHVGDRIELATPTGELSLPIVGVVPDYVSDFGSVLLNRKLLVERWGERTITRVMLYLEPGAALHTVKERVERQLGSRYRLKVLTLRQVLAYHAQMINRALAFMDAIQLLVAIVTVSGILDLLLSTIFERRRELAVWRLIGAGEGSVRRSVVIEAVTIGVLGTGLGIAVGLVTSLIWVRINFRYLLGYHLQFHFPVGATAWYALVVVLMSAVAGYGAARAATRESVLLGIRSE